MFKPLTKENIGGIVDLLINDINKRLTDKELMVELTDAAKNYVIESAYDVSYGARPLKRYLQKHIETLAARYILSDKAKPTEAMVVDLVDGELVIK